MTRENVSHTPIDITQKRTRLLRGLSPFRRSNPAYAHAIVAVGRNRSERSNPAVSPGFPHRLSLGIKKTTTHTARVARRASHAPRPSESLPRWSGSFTI